MVDCCSLGKSARYFDRFVNLLKENNKKLHNRILCFIFWVFIRLMYFWKLL